jgi:hypothetical protein
MEMLLPSLELASRDRGSRRRSSLVSRNVTVDGHRTSVRLEPAMWDALTYVCQCERKSLHGVVSEIAHGEMASSLTGDPGLSHELFSRRRRGVGTAPARTDLRELNQPRGGVSPPGGRKKSGQWLRTTSRSAEKA